MTSSNELLAKGAIETSSGGAGFYSSMFMVPKHAGGLQPILNLKHFNCYMHISSFKMPTHKHGWQLIQWHNVPYQWKVLPFGMATAPRVFTALTKPIFFSLLLQRFPYCYLLG